MDLPSLGDKIRGRKRTRGNWVRGKSTVPISLTRYRIADAVREFPAATSRTRPAPPAAVNPQEPLSALPGTA